MQRKLILSLVLVLILGGAASAFFLSKKPVPQPANHGTVNADAGVQPAMPNNPTPSPTVTPTTPPAATGKQPGTPPKTGEAPKTQPGNTGRPKTGAAPRPNTAGGANNNNARQGGGATFDREKFAQFRENHKYTFQLTRLVGNIARLDRYGKNPLSAQQAKELLAALTPLRSQEKLTQDDAKAAIRDVQRVLTEAQRTEIAAMPERGGGMRGGQGGGGMRGGGPGGPPPGGPGGPPPGGMRGGGDRPTMDPTTMQNFNPFYTGGSDDAPGGRMARRWDGFFDDLAKKAGQ